MANYPKLRDDIKVQTETVEGVVYYNVKEATTGKFIRLREPEYFLLRSLDGSRDAQEASDLFIKTFNSTIDPAAVEQFAAKLGTMGFLEGQEAAKKQAGKSILFIKLKAFNPDKMLDRLYPRVKWLFSKPGITFQVLLIALGVGVFVTNLEHFPFSLSAILRAADIATIIISFFVIITVHEFAHAFACKRYGGSVREMGFLLLYFQPCFYCNLSDAYLFPEKRQRLIVTFAGVFFQSVLFSMFTILWRLTVEGYLLNRVFYLTSAVCFATLAFNLNPAIKLDGYYLLADYLQIPNLRQKAYQFIWERIRVGMFGCAPSLPEVSRREAKIFWRYGLLSILYSTLLIIFVLYRGGEALIGHFGGTGFVLFVVVAFIIFRKLLSRWFRSISAIWRERREVWMKPKRIGFYAVAIVVIVLLAIIIHINQTTGGPARLVAVESYVVKRVSPSLLEGHYFRGGLDEKESSQIFQLASSDYSVTQIHPRYSVGDSVNVGDTLLVINSTLNSGQLAEAASDLRQAEADKRLLLSNPKMEEVATKVSEAKQAEAVFDAAKKEYARVKELHTKKLISDDDYERGVSSYNVAKSALDAKKSDIKLLKSKPKAAQIESIDAQIEKLKARRAYLEEQLKASTIISPLKGVIVGTSDPKDIFQLASTDTMIVEINLNESDLDILSQGSNMELRVSSDPGRPHTGKVLKFKLSPTLQAIAAVDNTAHLLLPEMSGYAKVDCGKCSVGGITLRKVTRFFRLEFWSWF